MLIKSPYTHKTLLSKVGPLMGKLGLHMWGRWGCTWEGGAAHGEGGAAHGRVELYMGKVGLHMGKVGLHMGGWSCTWGRWGCTWGRWGCTWEGGAAHGEGGAAHGEGGAAHGEGGAAHGEGGAAHEEGGAARTLSHVVSPPPLGRWKEYPVATTAYCYFFGALYMGVFSFYFVVVGRAQEFILPQRVSCVVPLSCSGFLTIYPKIE